MESIDIYELIYRDIKYSNNNINKESDLETPYELNKTVLGILKNTSQIIPEKTNEIKFSDVIYTMFPIVDKEKNIIEFKYEPIFINEKINENANEYVERYKSFDINNLPLIDIARLLNIKVEKSNQLKVFGVCKHFENKIVMGSDYVPTFIHELVHAIDFILPNKKHEKNYSEYVAELSAIVICKMYSIPIDVSFSMDYLNRYSNSEINPEELIKRVSLICSFIAYCKNEL
jgi:hypothetical protein